MKAVAPTTPPLCRISLDQRSDMHPGGQQPDMGPGMGLCTMLPAADEASPVGETSVDTWGDVPVDAWQCRVEETLKRWSSDSEVLPVGCSGRASRVTQWAGLAWVRRKVVRALSADLHSRLATETAAVISMHEGAERFDPRTEQVFKALQVGAPGTVSAQVLTPCLHKLLLLLQCLRSIHQGQPLFAFNRQCGPVVCALCIAADGCVRRCCRRALCRLHMVPTMLPTLWARLLPATTCTHTCSCHPRT